MGQIDRRSPLPARRPRRLGQTDWVRAALEVLSLEGVDAVTVGRLCRHLGVTKGSFYWHFRSRDGLLAAMAESWAEERIEGVLRTARERHPPGFARLLDFVRSSLFRSSTRDRAVRAWATHDPVAAREVDRADTQIVEFVADSLEAEGAAHDEAADLAKLLLFAGIGFFARTPAEDGAELERLARRGLDLLHAGLHSRVRADAQ